MTQGLISEAGSFRRGDVAVYDGAVPVHAGARPQFVPTLVGELFDWARTSELHPVLRSAVVHCEIETIHPFADGNGRTGRALVQSMLRSYGITQLITVPVSAGLLSEVEAYYAALTAYRRGELDPIVTEFARAAFRAIDNGETLIRSLARLRDGWAARVQARSHAAVWRALPVVMSQPAVTVNYLSERLRVSKPTAQAAIDQMVSAGILAPANNFRRNRVWVVSEVIDALDAFAERAGRRRFP